VQDSDIAKWQALHNSRLTTAMASAKVGRGLAYHAAVRTARAPTLSRPWAHSVTNE